VTGTSTPKVTFSDAGLTVPNANPIVADSAGVFGDIFPEGGLYRLILEDANGNVLFTADDVDGAIATGGGGGGSSGAGSLNRIVNGSMAISQEHGGSNVDVTTGTVYVIDQWAAALSSTLCVMA
jgi:urocanate hydratase